MAPCPVLVTGETGRIGSAFVQRMAERGIPVRLGTRRPEAAAVALRCRFGPGRVEAVQLPLDDPEALARGQEITSAGCIVRARLRCAPERSAGPQVHRSVLPCPVSPCFALN